VSRPYDHIVYVRRNDSPWGLGIPANATLISDTPYGREYGWNDAPDTAPVSDVADALAARIAAPPVIGNVDGSSRITVSWEPDPEPDPEPKSDLFDGIATLYPVDRRLTVHQFLALTFTLTDEERDAAIEILQGKAATTIHVTGRGWGKTRRRWVWDRLVRRLLEEPLPARFWGNVHGYRMLDDTLGRDIIHTLTRDRA
jgi:hypothetical protein